MPGVAGDKFYMMISSNYEFSEESRDMINAGIARLEASGEAEAMLEPYL